MRNPSRCCALLTALLAAGPALNGCVRRVLAIDSHPPGARVTVNGHNVGTTPTGPIPFQHYGRYEIIVERDGYLPLRVSENIRAPWYTRFPVDLFTELLWPGRIQDRHALSYRLQPAVAPNRSKVLRRARVAADVGEPGERKRPPSGTRADPDS